MKQTAVEWLEKEMLKPNLSMKDILEIAKEMEKQNIVDSVNKTNEKWQSQKAEVILSGKQYFNQTFINK